MASASELEQLRDERDGVSARIGRLRKSGEPVEDLIRRSQELTARIKELEAGQERPASARTEAEVGGMVVAATSAAEVTALAEEWRNLCRERPPQTLFGTWEWLDAWYSGPGARCCYCLQARDAAGELLALAPLAQPEGVSAAVLAGSGAGAGAAELLLQPGREQEAAARLLQGLADDSRLREVRLAMTPQTTLRWLLSETPLRGLRLAVLPGARRPVVALPQVEEPPEGAVWRTVTDPQEVAELVRSLPRRPSRLPDADRLLTNLRSVGTPVAAVARRSPFGTAVAWGVLYGDCLYPLEAWLEPGAEQSLREQAAAGLVKVAQEAGAGRADVSLCPLYGCTPEPQPSETLFGVVLTPRGAYGHLTSVVRLAQAGIRRRLRI